MSLRSSLTTAMAVFATVCLVSAGHAQYEEAAWTDFAYAYEFDSAPGSYDLDGNGSPDFTDPGLTPVDGVITINNNLFGSDANGIWHGNIGPTAYATGYTFEFRAKVLSETGTAGAMDAFMSPADSAVSALVGIGASKTYWSSSIAILDENDNTDDFHTFRVAQKPGRSAFYVWRDGELIGSSRGQGYSYANPAFWVGCGSGRATGTIEMDYFAITPGMVVPVGFEIPTADPVEAITERASDSFTYKYEMDVDPTDVGAIDLDGNGTADFRLVQGGPGTAGLSGNGTYSIEAPDAGSSWYLSSGATGEVWPGAAITAGEGYTVEVRVKVHSQLDETSAPFAVASTASNASDIGIVTMTTGNTRYYGSSIIDESDNSDDFHTIRIVRSAFEFEPVYWVWRDGVLMTPDGVGASAWGSSNTIYLGDVSGSSGGSVEIDYVRFTSGAYAPVDWTYPSSEELPGDLNGDGMVGSADLDIVRANWGSTVTPGDLTMGDASGDGSVGSADLDIVRANWGQSAPANVPEPSALLLLISGTLLIWRRR